jgi:type VI secretion system protein ImpB
MSSIHNYLQKIRPPYVHIRYDVQVGNAIERRELPFVVAVLADLSGQRRGELPKLKKRPFVEINRTNFDGVLAGVCPVARFDVENRLSDGGPKLPINLEFKSIDDFHPVAVAQQLANGDRKVAEIAKLMELRRRIKKMLTTMDGSDELEGLVQTLINDESARKQLCHSGRGGGEPGEGQA